MHERHTTTRRSALRTIGGAALGFAGMQAATGGAVAMAEYDVIDVSGHETIDVHDYPNSVLENVLIDQRGSGNTGYIDAQGSGGFTIRNVGFLGKAGDRGNKQIKVEVGNPGATGVIDNVYLPGVESQNRFMGLYVDIAHAGTLEIRNSYVGGYSDNGFYTSAPGDPGQNGDGGVTHIDNCYALNNNISGFRIGSNGSTIRNSVAISDRSDYPGHWNGPNARAIWFLNEPDLMAENCQVWSTAGWYAVNESEGGCGTLRDCAIEGPVASCISESGVQSLNSRPPVPEGVPTSAEMAASGGSSSGGDGGNGDTGSRDLSDAQGDVFEIHASGSGGAWFTTGEGAEISGFDAGNGANAINDSDVSVNEWEDGTSTVNTTVSASDADAFDIVGGGIIAIDSAAGVSPTYYWNGDRVSPSDVPLTPTDTGGNGDGGTPMYDGHPRSEFGYTGNDTDAFNAWVAGEITTEEFQSTTDQGHGTAALVYPGDGETQSNLNAGVLLLVGLGYAAYRAATGQNR